MTILFHSCIICLPKTITDPQKKVIGKVNDATARNIPLKPTKLKNHFQMSDIFGLQ